MSKTGLSSLMYDLKNDSLIVYTYIRNFPDLSVYTHIHQVARRWAWESEQSLEPLTIISDSVIALWECREIAKDLNPLARQTMV